MRTTGAFFASHGSSRWRQAGMTLLEAMVCTGIVVVLAGPLISVVLVSSRSTAESASLNQISERNRISLYRVAQETRTAIGSTIVITNSGATLAFSLSASYDGSSVVAGDSILYNLGLATGETSNSVDDNGNGLVDEGRLIRVNASTSETTTICENIDLSSSSFVWDSTTLTINLTTAGQIITDNSTFSNTKSVSVVPRN